MNASLIDLISRMTALSDAELSELVPLMFSGHATGLRARLLKALGRSHQDINKLDGRSALALVRQTFFAVLATSKSKTKGRRPKPKVGHDLEKIVMGLWYGSTYREIAKSMRKSPRWPENRLNYYGFNEHVLRGILGQSPDERREFLSLNK